MSINAVEGTRPTKHDRERMATAWKAFHASMTGDQRYDITHLVRGSDAYREWAYEMYEQRASIVLYEMARDLVKEDKPMSHYAADDFDAIRERAAVIAQTEHANAVLMERTNPVPERDESDFFFDPRPTPSAAVFDFETIGYRAAELAFWEREITAASEEDIAKARRDLNQGWMVPRPNDAAYAFDAIGHHRDVMNGNAASGVMWSNQMLSEPNSGQERRQAWWMSGKHPSQREHTYHPGMDGCSVCLWNYTAIEDGFGPRLCPGKAPKGEKCINCGKPHVIEVFHFRNPHVICLSCNMGASTGKPVPDRGAVRFEQRMAKRQAKNRVFKPDLRPTNMHPLNCPCAECDQKKADGVTFRSMSHPHRDHCPCADCYEKALAKTRYAAKLIAQRAMREEGPGGFKHLLAVKAEMDKAKSTGEQDDTMPVWSPEYEAMVKDAQQRLRDAENMDGGRFQRFNGGAD